ncbi:MAG: long-chain fatty acid--CoA ligase [Gammaproteobacteria bacterium]
MTQWNKDAIPLEAARTLDGLFRERVRRTPEAVAYTGFDRASGAWADTTWKQMGEQVAQWRRVLAHEGLRPGERVAIVMRNCREWVIFDQAALAAGLVVVPLYTDDRPDNVAYILSDSAAKLLLVQDINQWRRLQPALASVNSLQCILVAGGAAEKDLADARAQPLDAWLNKIHEADERSLTVNENSNEPHQLASIVYTSGTTGRPKGVMLSHHNMLSNAHAILNLIDVFREDVFISLLPLSHTLERTANYYMPMMAGATVAYNRSINQLGEDLQALRPTVMICVPRVLERFHARITAQMQKESRLVRSLFRMTVSSGWNCFEYSQVRAHRTPQGLLWPFFKQRVASKITDKFGGRLRLAICGGAPLPQHVAHLFIGLGLPVLQGYGLTESSPVISVNTPQDNDPASVGVLLPGVEVRIGAQDELLARGPGVMLGYWNNHSASYERIDPEGWLRTGDQARIANGHIYITGRIKDILVLSNGEKVPPADMEMAIINDPLFEQALVLGEGQPHLAALLVVNAEHWEIFAAEIGVDPKAPASVHDSRAHNQMIKRVAQQLRAFPGYAKVRRVALLSEPWSVENGLLTPTMKIKRNEIIKQYSGVINTLFAEPA